MCTKWASKKFGATRYCGTGPTYETGGTDCRGKICLEKAAAAGKAAAKKAEKAAAEKKSKNAKGKKGNGLTGLKGNGPVGLFSLSALKKKAEKNKKAR